MVRAIAPRLFRVIVFWLAFVCPAIANEPASETERLIAKDEWGKAARLIFAEARATYKHEPSIITGQAKAGLIEDALETIEGTNPGSRSWLLMSLVREAPSLSPEKRDELVRKALDSARNHTGGTAPNYIKSADLTRIALYHSGQGAEGDAKAIFAEALAAAERGLAEENSGGFRQVTEEMRRTRPGETKPWMLSALRVSLSKATNQQNLAFACIDMVVVSGRFKNHDLVGPFIECAASSIPKIDKASIKTSASEGLAKAKDEAGYSSTAPSASPFMEAIREARAGNAEKSYAVVSALGQNLYVSHKQAAYEQVLDDAFKRGDLITALYFAERPMGQLFYQELSVWRRLAEKQIEIGDRQSASASYRKASSALSAINSSPNIYLFHIQSVLFLGESMLQNGMKVEGRRTLLLAQSLLDRISMKQVADRVNASISVSESLWRIGMQTEAKKLSLQAYLSAHSADAKRFNGDMEKARLLSRVGQSISMYSKSKPAIKPSSKKSKERRVIV